MSGDIPAVYHRPSKAIRKEASDVLMSGRVSGARLMTAVLMLIFCLMLSAFSAQAAMYAFELSIPIEGDDLPLWYLICEYLLAAAALIFAAAPGWAGFGELCGRLAEYHRFYGDSPEQPGIELRSLLRPWTRGNYIRHLRAGFAAIVDALCPISIIPLGYLAGRYIGWATPRPFDLPVVVLVNLAAWAIAAAVLRLISMFSLTPRLICEEKLGLFKAMAKSYAVNRTQRRRFFRLRLSFIGWWLLTFVSCGLALFWTLPLWGVSRRILGDELIRDFAPQSEDDIAAGSGYKDAENEEKESNTDNTDNTENTEENTEKPEQENG